MKTIQPADAAQRLLGEVRLARFQLARAESQLVEAKAQARLARQRRKAAKLVARKARQQAKLAEEQVAEAEVALAKLEARLARPVPIKHKPRKLPSVATIVPTDETLKVRKPVVRRAKSKLRTFSAPEFLVTPVAIVPPEDCKPTFQIIKGVEEIFTAETGEPENLALSDQDSCPPDQELTTSAAINQ